MEGTKDYDESNMNAIAGPSSAMDEDVITPQPGSEPQSPEVGVEIDPSIQQDLEEGAAEVTEGGEAAKEAEVKEATQSMKGKGKGWRKGLGKPKPEKKKRKTYVATKTRMPARKMERYECRGSVVINIHHDDKTAYFTVTHALQHPDYVDVVGNRLRGARFVPQPLEIVSSILPPVGSTEFQGATPIESLEKTLAGMISFVNQLKSYRGGGEQEIAQQMYDSTLELRKLRTATAEVMEKSANKKPNKGVNIPTKRAISEVDGTMDEERRDPVASGSNLDQQIDQQLQQQLRYDRQLHQQILDLDPHPLAHRFDTPALLRDLDGTEKAGAISPFDDLASRVAAATRMPDEFMTGYIPEEAVGAPWLDPTL